MTKRFSAIRERLGLVDLVQNSSVSPLAAGDNAPVGSKYLGPGGQPWTKTGTTTFAWVPDLLRSPYFNVKEYGALGNNTGDDTAAINLAIAAAQAVGGGVVFFPSGIYSCLITPGPGIDYNFRLNGAAQGNILFMGCGRGSQIFQNGSAAFGDTRLFSMENGANNVGFKSLYINSDVTDKDPAEQNHALEWTHAVAGAGDYTGDAFVLDCEFGYFPGDGIRLLGPSAADKRIRRILIKRNVFRMRNPITLAGSRAPLSFQRRADEITADLNYMTGSADQLIDFEPTGFGSLNKNKITRNILDHDAVGIQVTAVTLTGNGGADPADKTVFGGNTLINGCIFSFDNNFMLICSNLVECERPGPIAAVPICIAFQGLSTQIQIVGNQARQGTGFLTAGPSIRIVAGGAGQYNYFDEISGNIAANDSALSGGTVIECDTYKRIAVRKNLARHMNSVANQGLGISMKALTVEAEDTLVAGNMVLATDEALVAAISISTSGFDHGNACILDNLTRNSTVGARFEGVEVFTEQIMISRNVLVGINQAFTSNQAFTPIDGVASLTRPVIFAVTEDPEGAVPAAIGSIALRNAVTALYVKEADDGLNTGWAVK